MPEISTELIRLGSWTFNEITTDDINMYSHFIRETDYPVNLWSSSFAYIWAISQSKMRKVLWKIVDDMLVTFIHSYKDSLYLMLLPMGRGSPEKVVRVLYKCMNYCYDYNGKDTDRTLVKMINDDQLEFLRECTKFDLHFKLVNLMGIERHYDINKLVTLSGKEFENVRNRLKKFHRDNPDAQLLSYNPSEFDEVMELGNRWSEVSGKKYQRIFDTVYFREIIRNFEVLKQKVMVIKKQGCIIGAVSGSVLPTGQSWGSLIKYENGIPGLSETLIVEFAREIHNAEPNAKYLNVGSDLGPGGLREYKLKFRPVLNFKRYQVYLKV